MTPALLSNNEYYTSTFTNTQFLCTGPLVTQVEQHKSDGQVKNALLNASPYLSDKTMLTLINKNKPYSPGIIKEVILANSPVEDTVMNALINRNPALPQGIINEILAAQTGISERALLENRIGFFLAERELAVNELIRNYLYNDTLAGKLDSVIAVLEAETRIDAKLILVSAYLENGDTTSTQSLIDSLRQFSELTNFCDLQQLFINAGDTVTGAIVEDSLTRQLIEQIAFDTVKAGSMQARILLEQLFNQRINEVFIFPDQIQFKMGSGIEEQITDVPVTKENETGLNNPLPVAAEQEEYHLTNYPNPFSEGTIIAAYLPGHFERFEIMIYDILGNVIMQYPLKAGHNFIEIKSDELKHGIYFYSLITQGTKIESRKLVHVK